jgi:hypothetical protein
MLSMEQTLVRGPVAQGVLLPHDEVLETVAIGVPQATPVGASQVQVGHVASGAIGVDPPCRATVALEGHDGMVVPVLV